MSELAFAALVLAGIGPLLAVARLVRLPDTLVLFGAGVLAAYLPGLPHGGVDPQLMLDLFLPPILYAATVRVSFHLLRFTLISGVLLGAVLSLMTIAAAALVARLLVPDLSWNAAWFLGAVVAVFDMRLFHEAEGRPHVSRAVADALKTREMMARIAALMVFGLALDALTGGPPTPLAVLGAAAWGLAGGAVVGLVLGRVVVWVRERIDPAPIEIAVSLATPFLGSLLAEALDLSVVVVIMAAALVISAVRIDPETGAPRTSSEARINAMAFWEAASLILSAVLFFLAGRALPQAAAAVGVWPASWLAGVALAVLAAVLAVQFLVSYLSAALPSPAEELEATSRRSPRLRMAAVMSWASTRSVLGLVIALSIPGALPDGAPLGERDLVLVVAALTIVGSALLQGLTLNAVVHRAGFADTGETREEERLAEAAMEEAGHEAHGAGKAREGFHAERRALLDLRRENAIGDETLRKMLREADLRQRAAEGSALPGAGPPNP
jgi:CPA1 family monovalent cation:H+ antiporter